MTYNEYDLTARAVDQGAAQCAECLGVLQDDLPGPDGKGQGRDAGEEICEDCRRKEMGCTDGR